MQCLELRLNQMENTQGGKFWGKSCVRSGDMYLEETNGTLECWQDWSCSYSVFWIPIASATRPGGC